MRRERVGAEVYVFKIQQWVVVEGNWQLNLRLLVTLSMALVRIRDVILLFLHYVPRFASLCCTGAVDSGRNINGATLDFPTWLFLLNLIPQAPKQCAAPHARHLRCGVTESAAVPGIHANGLVHTKWNKRWNRDRLAPSRKISALRLQNHTVPLLYRQLPA